MPTGMDRSSPLDFRTSAHYPTGLAHKMVVMNTPTKGSHGLINATGFLRNSLSSTPNTVGMRTTWKVDSAKPCRGGQK